MPAFLLAICFHEAAHAWMAFLKGDTTARDHGRLTLNPFRHLDPMGTIVFLLAGFGWAKPVPVDPRNLRDPLRDGVWIAAAGPGANIALAVTSAILIRVTALVAGALPVAVAQGVATFLFWSITVNLVLAVFNMIPLHPLDGSKVVLGLLPERAAWTFARLNTAGPMLLMGLILLGAVTGRSFLGAVLWPPVEFLRSLLLFGMS